jgi:hypothetical protein
MSKSCRARNTRERQVMFLVYNQILPWSALIQTTVYTLFDFQPEHCRLAAHLFEDKSSRAQADILKHKWVIIFITTGPATHLDGKNVVFGEVVEGQDIV